MPPASGKISPANRSSRGGDSIAADAGSSTPERRRMRNRMSQRAFRARQTLRIQELEKRLDEQALPDESTLVVQLQDDNARLREQLLGVHKKAHSLQISLRGLAEEAARALGLDQDISSIDRTGVEQNGGPESQTLPLETTSPSDTTVELDAASCMRSNTLPGGSDCIFSDVLLRERTTFGSEDASVRWPNQSNSAPVLDCFIDTLAGPDDPSFQMTAVDPPALHVRAPHYPLESLSGPSIGFDRYKDLLDRAAVISNAPQILRRTNSTFSDHIDAFESSLASQWPQLGLIRAADQQ
ncbi:hypothetical protein BDY17DRAFT_138062 [Neohortaea acidophila]|uniref:BZIP domain-containing protein n=1 Tax=Neohortaea acidophila TaxID=245834 RepID=A0A6A6PUK4_9PEZI|nr:uncharacterized protein BDY17DRAFT_138062 [Neohortaea acidophila]KAF2482907.1 hypothetical protein BDY17DRAFT_138062 [Neohortaea acidophila]